MKKIFVVLTFCSAVSAMAAAPKGIPPGDWAAIRAEYEKHQRALYPEGSGFRARSLSQQWTTRFDGRGFEVTPDGGAWWGMSLESYGYPGAAIQEGWR